MRKRKAEAASQLTNDPALWLVCFLTRNPEPGHFGWLEAALAAVLASNADETGSATVNAVSIADQLLTTPKDIILAAGTIETHGWLRTKIVGGDLYRFTYWLAFPVSFEDLWRHNAAINIVGHEGEA